MSSILLVEDHMGFAKTIQHFLDRQIDVEIVGVVQSGEAALKTLRELTVDLVQQIIVEFPHLRCLMLSGHMIPKYVKRSLDVGAS